MFAIRPATRADAPVIARVHVASWQTTYRGLLPDALIAAQTVERRTRQWEHILQGDRASVFVATDAAGVVVGFASCGPCGDAADAITYPRELYALYLLQEAQGQGLGRALVRTVAQHLAAGEMTAMIVWVLATNPARRFYESLGGQYVRAKADMRGDIALDEVAYGWRDTSMLM